MRIPTPIPVALVVTLASCAAPPRVLDREVPAVVLAAADRPEQRLSLPEGTRVQLMSLAVHREGAAEVPPAFLVNAWWRIGMRQSVRFDVAAGLESCPSPDRIRLHFDAVSQTFTTTLERDEKPPIALAAVRGGTTANALDRLAYLTRAAMGESISMPPIPCQVAYSAVPECVRYTEMGMRRRVDGDPRGALTLFERARSYDGGCALTLLHLAKAIANQGGETQAGRADQVSREALGFRQRLTPETEHRLARVLLTVHRDDTRMLELGRAYQEDRPHDPQGAYTIALAQNKAGDHKEALPTLQRLRSRWPRNPFVRYQLSFALLSTGDPETALVVLDEARRQLTGQALVRPYTMALFHAGKHDELRRFLVNLRRKPGVAGSVAEIEVLRMQASHAILEHKPDEAARFLAESLAWVRDRSSELNRHSIEVAEDGEVLIRLGHRQVLRQGLDGFYELGDLPSTFGNVLVYLEGLLRVDANGTPTRELAALQTSKDTVWHNQLLAAMHHRRGELEEETAALQRAVATSTNPMTQANVARALEAAGQREAAAEIATFVHDRLLSFDQRKPREHPLMSPGRALAYLATER